MNTSKKIRRFTTAVAIAYSIWLVFFSLCFYLDILSLPDSVGSWGFAIVLSMSIILVSSRIEELRYSPLILIMVFALMGRFVGFFADYLSVELTGNILFMLPFGTLRFFLFNFLMIGFFHYYSVAIDNKTAKPFNAVILTPVLLFTLPVSLHLLQEGVTVKTVYSFGYTAVSAWTLITAISFWRTFSGKKLFAIAAGVSILIEMFAYYTSSVSVLPPKVGILLAPYVFILIVIAAAGITKDEIND